MVKKRRIKIRIKRFIRTFKRPIIILASLLLIILVLNITNSNYVVDTIKDRTNLIINNSNVTKDLNQNIYVENEVVYISTADIKNFFDNTIMYDSNYNMIITCGKEKVASITIGNSEIEVNSAKVKLKSFATEKDGIYYLPLSELGDIYGIKTIYEPSTNIVTVDYLSKEYIISTANKNVSVKYKPENLSKTVAKVKKGDSVIIVNNNENIKNGWTKIRTTSGILGYVKTNKIGQMNYIRENMPENIKEENVITWNVFSSEYNIKDRTATLADGTKILSPTFFNLRDESKGKLNVLIENNENKYINWAHKNGYKIWASVSNRGYKNTTKDALNDYKNRKYMIEQIVDYIVTYKLDGINISFTSIPEESLNNFSRFLTELEPRLNEIGAVLSVDTLEASSGIVKCTYKASV